ncbi:MAG: PAS domain-containing protein [Desulfobacterales bacterium]|nr:MAG: PAS domain-containing protein [Desulfobacterales bacterium]
MEKQGISDRNNILCDQWLEILDELNIGAFTVGVQRQVSAMNLSAQALMGMKDSEVIGKDCGEVFVGVPCLADCHFRREGDPEAEGPDVEIIDETDTKHLVTRLATPVYGSNHQVVGCLTILQDHSPIVALIDRVQHEERSLKIILDNLDVGIFTVNRGGHLTFFNTAAEKITGYDRREVLGKPCSALFEGAAPEELCLLEASIAEGGNRSRRRSQILTRDGGSLPIRAAYMALRNEKGTVVGGLATFHDLTLVQQLHQAMEDRYTFYDMVGREPAMQKIFEMVNVVADTDATILIEGPTGTGKDLLAKVIHSVSRRAARPPGEGQLLRYSGQPARIGTVRLCQRGLYRGRQGQIRTVSGGGRRYDFSGRDRRSAAGPAGQTFAGAGRQGILPSG